MKVQCIAVLSLIMTLTLTAADVERFTAEAWRAKLEADWTLEARHRSNAERQGSLTTKTDASGACDGIKDGKWGFHTGLDLNPWWQVDLGQPKSITRIVIWNRCDSPDRAKKLQILLSEDNQQWRKVYAHAGPVFFGFTDGKPLTVSLKEQTARFVRIQLTGREYLHLDEVEVFAADSTVNLALDRRADQASISQWSQHSANRAAPDWNARTRDAIAGSQRLVAHLRDGGMDVSAHLRSVADLTSKLVQVAAASASEGTTSSDEKRSLYFEARSLQRKLALANPLLNFDSVLFTKRKLGSFSHMSDQYYGWWSRGGGGIYLLEDFKSETPAVRCLTAKMPEGSFLRPELSFDGKKISFAYCRYYPHVAGETNKTEKMNLPEDSFYHVYEMNLDGSGLRQLTHGRYNDFDARYLPNGEIVFLSTRRGQATQANKHCATRTLKEDALPDSFVRCGGGDWRPVSVYTLHVMAGDGKNMRTISPFENFEWTPSVANDGRIFYSRWDYIDRDNMPYMSLWSTNPDGTNPQLIYGNFTHSPHATLEARPIPGSRKLIFTASAHHSYTAGSLVLLDPIKGTEGSEPLTRLTPEVCFPEIECWPDSWYAGPYPLSEDFYLTAWSSEPIHRENMTPPVNGAGLYLYDSSRNRDLLYRDNEISSMDPIPVRAVTTPPLMSSNVEWDGPQDGRFMVLDVYDGMDGAKPGDIKNLRVVAVPAKTQPQMNTPNLGMTRDDPGKTVLGTVPVEADGSAYFRVPSGVNVFFQALNAEGMAVQTMRTVTYVQPNQTLSCVGCHESRNSSPKNYHPLAAAREPSRLTPGPEGSWPLRFDKLVQPVLDKNCVTCHNPRARDSVAAKFDLSGNDSYNRLVSWGKPSLRDHVAERYRGGKSIAGQGPAMTSALLAYLRTNAAHDSVQLDQDSHDRLVTWMDTYAQRLGSFSDEQERELEQLKNTFTYLIEK